MVFFFMRDMFYDLVAFMVTVLSCHCFLAAVLSVRRRLDLIFDMYQLVAQPYSQVSQVLVLVLVYVSSPGLSFKKEG